MVWPLAFPLFSSFKIVLAIPFPLPSYIKFKTVLSISTKKSFLLRVWKALGKTHISVWGELTSFTVLSQPIHEHTMFLHVFQSPWISFVNMCGFQHTSPVHALLYLQLSISYFLWTTVSGILFKFWWPGVRNYYTEIQLIFVYLSHILCLC